jgi:hypothetical protein
MGTCSRRAFLGRTAAAMVIAPLSAGAAHAAPVNPKATPEARALLGYIARIGGANILSGQHNFPGTLSRFTERVNALTGTYPAIWGQDFGFSAEGQDGIGHRAAIIGEAKKQHAAGSIITLMWHAVRPVDDEPNGWKESVQNRLTAEQWNEAQGLMEKILNHLGVNYTVGIDEAAFYGPKLDIQAKNVHGKEDTLITIQIDMLLAKKFGMEYVDVDGQKRNPYIIHRTSLGCYERTLAMLLEKYAGALPTWIAPEQVRVLPITDRAADYADEVARKLTATGYRVEIDHRNEKIGYKIREAQVDKIPYMLVIGDKEAESGQVAVLSRSEGDLGAMSYDDFAALLGVVVGERQRK